MGGAKFSQPADGGPDVAKRFIILTLLLFFTLSLQIAWSQQTAGPAVTGFKAQPLYRAASLTWKIKGQFKQGVAFHILRSDASIEGPYEEVGAVNYDPSKSSYEYVDKSMGTEVQYYYKLSIDGTGESYGPVSARPYFSPPATDVSPRPRFG